jgi:hypothetical protein
MTLLRHLVLRWDALEGFYFVGPFASEAEATTWVEDNVGTDSCWMVGLLDPAAPLEVRPPGEMPELEPDPKLPFQWIERPANVGDFYLLMVGSDPLHLVGPFPEDRQACSWAVANEARNDYDGWQLVWLDDPTAPAKLLTPTEGAAEAARREEEWQCSEARREVMVQVQRNALTA